MFYGAGLFVVVIAGLAVTRRLTQENVGIVVGFVRAVIRDRMGG